MIATRFLISGRVQGVWFRASTQAEAERLGLVGYAHNLADGRVEVLAVGSPSVVAEMSAWLEHGPPNARVESIDTELLDVAAYEDLATFTCA